MVNLERGPALAGWRGEHVPPGPPESRTDLTRADGRIVLAVIPLTAAAVVTGAPIAIGLWPVALVAVALIVIGAVAGQTLCLRSQARHLARRQASPDIPVPADERRPR
jgi:hypothetical protein